MIDTLIQGKLRGAVTIKTAANGNPYATFKIGASDKKGEGVLVSCIAWDAVVIDAVARLTDGDSVAVSGEASIGIWRGNDGTPCHGLDVTVHLAMTAYHAGRKRTDKTSQSEHTS